MSEASAGGPASGHGDHPRLAIGGRAPDFSLPDADGTRHALADYRGRAAVILYFLRAFT
jgi:peroxiredoxin Q/BCP